MRGISANTASILPSESFVEAVLSLTTMYFIAAPGAASGIRYSEKSSASSISSPSPFSENPGISSMTPMRISPASRMACISCVFSSCTLGRMK